MHAVSKKYRAFMYGQRQVTFMK